MNWILCINLQGLWKLHLILLCAVIYYNFNYHNYKRLCTPDLLLNTKLWPFHKNLESSKYLLSQAESSSLFLRIFLTYSMILLIRLYLVRENYLKALNLRDISLLEIIYFSSSIPVVCILWIAIWTNFQNMQLILIKLLADFCISRNFKK